MRKRANLLLLLCLAALCGVNTASAAPVAITFGRDIQKLQDLVDRRYGRNHIDVTKDFIGARSGDIDPWFWVGDRTAAVKIELVKRRTGSDVVGWYEEGGNQARMPDGGGVLISGQVETHEEAMVTLPGSRMSFGFYVDAVSSYRPILNGPVSGATSTRRFFTNRSLNDRGPDGTGAIHAPYDGDVQALVYDASRWAGPGTWLVCFEDQDTGGRVVDDDGGDNDVDGKWVTFGKLKRRVRADNDFFDVVFEVRADGATPAHTVTFGGLKLLYR